MDASITVGRAGCRRHPGDRSLVVGVAAASASPGQVLLTAVEGLVAGAMAATAGVGALVGVVA